MAGRPSVDRDPETALPPAWLAEIVFDMRDVVLVLTKDRQIRYGNRAANLLLARKHPFKVRCGRLEANSPAAALDLGRAVDRACSNPGAKPELLVLRRDGGDLMIVSIRCLDASGGGVIWLLACDPTVEPPQVVHVLRHCFGLTKSEAEVAAAVANGVSSSQLAFTRGVSVNTIRTQIKTIAAKLGCKRQAQIGAIARAVPLQPG